MLPFANLSGDPEQDYFADAIVDDLTTDLSHISGSFVIARNTAFTYKGKAVDVKEVGRELVLDGRAQQARREPCLPSVSARRENDDSERRDDGPPAPRKSARRARSRCRLALRGWLGCRRLVDFERIDVDGLRDVLKLGWSEIGDLEIETPLHLPVGLLREADRARLGDAL